MSATDIEKETHRLLDEKSSDLAALITKLHFDRNPDLDNRYGHAGKERCYEDAIFHLNFLSEAINVGHPVLYGNYIIWAESMLQARNIPKEDLHKNIIYLQEAVGTILGNEHGNVVKEYVEIAKEKLLKKPEGIYSFIKDDNPLHKEVQEYIELLLNGEREQASILINDLVEQGIPIVDLYLYIFQVSQYEIGLYWQNNRITVAHEHYCTAATQLIMSGLYHLIFSTDKKGKNLVACTLGGELHELGIRMVADFFEMDGWDTYYLGANMPDPQLIGALQEKNADVLAISVTLPSHVGKTANLIKSIRGIKELSHIKIIVGGYLFLHIPDMWKTIGADAFAEDAQKAIIEANKLITDGKDSK